MKPTAILPTKVEASESEDSVVQDANKLQYVWLIIVPIVILFGIGKFCYERKHNTSLQLQESIKGKSVCALTEKFFEEERKYRELAEVKSQCEKDLNKEKQMTVKDADNLTETLHTKDETFEDVSVCFFEIVDIEVK